MNSLESTFINFTFTGPVSTLDRCYMSFRNCRFHSGFSALPGQSLRAVRFVECRITGTLACFDDATVDVDSCWFDHGTIVTHERNFVRVFETAFTGPAEDEVEQELSRPDSLPRAVIYAPPGQRFTPDMHVNASWYGPVAAYPEMTLEWSGGGCGSSNLGAVQVGISAERACDGGCSSPDYGIFIARIWPDSVEIWGTRLYGDGAPGLQTLMIGTYREQRDGVQLSQQRIASTPPGCYVAQVLRGAPGCNVVSNCTATGHIAVDVSGEGSGFVRRSTFHDLGGGIRINGYDGVFAVEDNVIERCGTGIEGSGSVHVAGNVVLDSADDGIHFSGMASASTLERNIVARSGRHGFYVERLSDDGGDNLIVRNNTSVGNAFSGFALFIDNDGWSHSVTHNISYQNHGHGLISLGPIPPTLSCNDWFENDSSAVSGMKASPDDLALDPLFCDVDHDSVTLAKDSPLLDAAGCGLIGARGMGCASTPTLLAFFAVDRVADGVRIRWRLADPARLNDVLIERAGALSGHWSMIAADRTTEGGVEVYVDRSASVENEYWYRLVMRDGNETVVIAEPLRIEAQTAGRFQLIGVSTNPSSGPLRITFAVAREAPVEIGIFDLMGRRVASLVDGSLPAGSHTVEWSGHSAASGVYLLAYRYPGGHQVHRVVRLR